MLAAIIGAITLVFVTLLKLMWDVRRAGTGVEKVSKQVHPNGGTSMKDIIMEIRRDVKALTIADNSHGERLVKLETILEERSKRDAGNP